jgi:protein-L-isoaspartate O-methyltransferase
MEPDWNLYRGQFPKRYWEAGEFDSRLTGYLNSVESCSILDVGGGVGTEVLKPLVDRHCLIDLLDPFVSSKPDWMNAKVGYDTDKQYDVIVIRGAINYLSLEQLSKISEMLKGVMFANTFLNPPSVEWTERAVENIEGQKGVERFRLQDRTIQHQVIFPDSKIEHEFHYRDRKFYEKVFPDVQFESYRNSTMLVWRK